MVILAETGVILVGKISPTVRALSVPAGNFSTEVEAFSLIARAFPSGFADLYKLAGAVQGRAEAGARIAAAASTPGKAFASGAADFSTPVRAFVFRGFAAGTGPRPIPRVPGAFTIGVAAWLGALLATRYSLLATPLAVPTAGSPCAASRVAAR